MRLLKLPTELVINVLIAAVYSRGLKRALRLRLVCKIFKALFYKALFATDLLDKHASTGSLDYAKAFYNEKRVPESLYLLWQSYLSFRVQSLDRPCTRRMSIIKQTADLFNSETGLLGDAAAKECIWDLSDIRIHASTESLFNDPQTPLEFDSLFDSRRCLLAAAARKNNIQLASVILEECATKGLSAANVPLFGGHNGFKCPAYIAARYASSEVLDLFLQHRTNSEFPKDIIWNGCGLGGTQETLNVILKHWPDDVIRSRIQSFGPARSQQFCALYASHNLDFFQRLRVMRISNGRGMPSDQVIPRVPQHGFGEMSLTYFASCGHSEVVEHLIKLDVPVNATAQTFQEIQPLRSASRGFHPDIVAMLLKHGTDPNQCDALFQGTKSGSLEVVRILLNSGANVEDNAKQLVKASISLEHTSMFNLLREYGALTQEAWESGLDEALKEGLESMVTLLRASDYRRVA